MNFNKEPMQKETLISKDPIASECIRISGSEAIVRSLIAEGVDVLYGYPGGAIMPVYDALYHFKDQLHHVLTRHEQGATHAAQGYARISGKVGVAIATSGPGATNLVTGIADAQIDSTPLVCITGQVTSSLLGSDAFQETDIIGNIDQYRARTAASGNIKCLCNHFGYLRSLGDLVIPFGYWC